MAIDLKERAPVARTMEVAPATVRRARRRGVATWMLVAVLMGVAAGAVAHSLVTVGDDAERAARIQGLRAEAIVEAHGRAWLAAIPAPSRVLVTGTGPGLAWVAEQQAAWAEQMVTGTGPGLVTVVRMQQGPDSVTEPTGTGPDLEHLPDPRRPEMVVVGTP